MAKCIHGLNQRTCSFCRVERQSGMRQVQMTPPPAPVSAVVPARVYCACPHGYLVHGAGGCWLCGCDVTWSTLSSRVDDGVRSERFPGAKLRSC